MAHDPVAVELNVDAALLLRRLVGIDSYPLVLALMPNVFLVEDQERVDTVVSEQLTRIGVLDDGIVHPTIERWLRCLYRPDVEMDARIVDTGPDARPDAMLRLALVRCGEDHVLALRSGDEVVIQSVHQQMNQLDAICAVLKAALGSCPPARFEPMTATLEQFTVVPEGRVERRSALMELGATPRTARVLSQALDETTRRAEVVMIEHHDGATESPELGLVVLDTNLGRIVVIPRRGIDGQIWSTYTPGDDSAMRAGAEGLIELLPARSWFGTSRS
ncbi:ESX secretion-associated protein EspG [Nocardia sp. CDC160]|uniref:ESX secretion-associated protein EspG n=1 Tax=Nocardia sp. CDC160 TaxID=3112166 RepID=UPI002DB60B90|nr:ESX secretion-associated protein EspG [Nocardia sp. CDC160]MEC3920217.1 ESX secretion-associated protein EspG [Nocardia sp. CDC160]